jgi:hypothetical protein
MKVSLRDACRPVASSWAVRASMLSTASGTSAPPEHERATPKSVWSGNLFAVFRGKKVSPAAFAITKLVRERKVKDA